MVGLAACAIARTRPQQAVGLRHQRVLKRPDLGLTVARHGYSNPKSAVPDRLSDVLLSVIVRDLVEQLLRELIRRNDEIAGGTVANADVLSV